MRLTQHDDRIGAARFPRGLGLHHYRSNDASRRDLHARIEPLVEQRGYHWGLFRGSLRCPVKDGWLRHYWLRGLRRGVDERRAAKKKPTGPRGPNGGRRKRRVA